MFGCETFRIEPDILVVSKQLSSSYMPIATFLINEKVFEPVADGTNQVGALGHGFTAGGHPVAAAVALENLKLIQERELVANVGTVGRHLQTRLKELEKHSIVGQVRGVGLIAAVELVADRETKEPWGAVGELGLQVNQELQSNGVLSRNLGDTIALCPPLITTAEQIDRVVDALDHSIRTVQNRLQETSF